MPFRKFGVRAKFGVLVRSYYPTVQIVALVRSLTVPLPELRTKTELKGVRP